MPAYRTALPAGWRILASGCTGGVLAALLATATGWIAAEYADDSGTA